MEYIYFLYGLAFFTLGTSILFIPKTGSRFRLAGTLSLIGIFGILHGINEWIDMIIMMKGATAAGHFRTAGLFILPLSYSFLVLFGTRSISQVNGKYSLLNWLPLTLLAAWGLITAASNGPYLAGNVWARYMLGVPGIFMTSFALLMHLPYFSVKIPSTALNIKIAAGAFFLYGIFSGLFVPRADFFPASHINDGLFLEKVGIPVQVFRTLCAIVFSYSTIAILRIFNWETMELRTLSISDELTGLLNRRGFFTFADQQLKIAKREGNEVFMLSADMDNLKEINDGLGHKEGDRALIDTARIIRTSFRESDVIARIGGDEFVVLQTERIDTDPDMLIARLQKNIEMHNRNRNRRYELSISVGAIRTQSEHSASIQELLTEADRLMYRNKKAKQTA